MSFVPPVMDFSFKVSGHEEIQRRFKSGEERIRDAVKSTLSYLAQQVASRARSRVPGRGRLARFVGYRFTLGKTGARRDEAMRVVIRGDIGPALGKMKAWPYAVEMGQLGRVKPVAAHERRFSSRSIGGEGKRAGRVIRGGTIHVSSYRRRFGNKAQPYIGPAGRDMKGDIEQALTVALPRRLARIISQGATE